MTSAVPFLSLAGLKRLATRRAKVNAITVEGAREQIAREYGYSSWALLIRSIQSPVNDAGLSLAPGEGPGT